MTETAKDLISRITEAKREAVNKGVIREEKALPKIENKEIPYELPDGWQWIRLGDYALKVTDYVASGSFASLKENVLITNEPNYAIMVKTADFSNGFTKNLTYTDEHGYDFLSNSNLFGGELILSNIGSIGKVFIVPYLEQPMTLASNTIMVKVTDDELIKYLYYYFLSPLGQRTLFSISSGTSMMKFNKTQLKNTLVPVAPLDVQRDIVRQIESVTKIIALRKEELNRLEDLIKARFVELFGNPIINEKGWDTAELNSVCDGIGDGLHGTPEYDESGDYPFINGNNLMNGVIEITPATKMVNEETYKKHFIELTDNAILLSINGTLGKLAFYNGEAVMLGKSACYCNLKPEINREFVYGVMKTDAFMGFLESNATASTIKNVGLKAIRGFSLILPPEELQTEFVEFSKQVDKSKFVLQH